MPLKASIDAGFRRFGGWLWECKSHPSNQPSNFPLNLLNLLKEKQQQHVRRHQSRESAGLLLFSKFSKSSSGDPPRTPMPAPSKNTRRVFSHSGLPSLLRDAIGKVGMRVDRGTQPGANRQNPVLQESSGIYLARGGAHRPFWRGFMAWEYPCLPKPFKTQ